MIKDQINLLPPPVTAQRNRRLYLDRLGTLLRRGQIMLVGLLVLVGILYTVLERIERDLTAQAARERPASEADEQRVARANQIIALVHAHGGQHPPVTPHLVEVTEAMPPGIQLTSVEWTDESRLLAVSGTFNSRETVTSFKTALEQLSWVEKLEAPLSNFATGPKPTFTFTVTVGQ